jgi:hypothetical protein
VENIQDRSDIQSSGELMDEQEHGEKAYDTNSSDNMSWLQGHATLTFGIIFYMGGCRPTSVAHFNHAHLQRELGLASELLEHAIEEHRTRSGSSRCFVYFHCVKMD